MVLVLKVTSFPLSILNMSNGVNSKQFFNFKLEPNFTTILFMTARKKANFSETCKSLLDSTPKLKIYLLF